MKIGEERRLVVQVLFANTGTAEREFPASFQKPAYKNVQVSVHDGQVIVTARKGKKSVTATFAG
jgi:hypothetical protein